MIIGYMLPIFASLLTQNLTAVAVTILEAKPSRRNFLIVSIAVSIGLLCAIGAAVIAATALSIAALTASHFGYDLAIFRFNNILSVVGAISIITLLIVEIRFWPLLRGAIQKEGAKERMRHIEDKVHALSKEHPELALVLEILNGVLDVQLEESGRRAFWSGIVQNIFFLLLGVATSIVVARLHWS